MQKNECVIVVNLLGDLYYYCLSDSQCENPFWTAEFKQAFVFPNYEIAEIFYNAHVPKTQFTYDITKIVNLEDIYAE